MPRMGGPNMRNFGQKPKAGAMKILGRLIRYLGGAYKVQMAFVLLCILISSLAGVVGTMFLRSLIDDYILPYVGQQSPDFTPLIRALLTMAFVYLLGILSSYIQSRLMLNISQGVLKKVRDDMFEHLQSLPIRYFDSHANGELMSRFTNDTDTLRQMISQSIPNIFSSIITVVSVFISMLILSLPLTAISIGMLVIMTFAVGKIGKQSSKYFINQQRDIGRINGYIEEMIEGQKVVKVFCHEENAKEGFDTINEQLCDSATNANIYANILGPVMNNLGHLQYVFTAVFGSMLAVAGVGGLTLGTLASFLQFTKSFSMPISQISQQFNSIIMALAGAERIFELMDEEPETDEGYVTLVNAEEAEDGSLVECDHRTGIWAWKHPHEDGTVTYTRLMGKVQFFDVTFGYTDEKIVLHDINLYAKPGQKIAFVGATGAGKTTITNLINRFYDIQEGKIRYDDINITKIRKSDLRRSLGMVLQDTHLFTGTILENIRYGRLDATDEEVIAAAKLANAHYFITHLEKGYDTVITGDGANLSQGQRQLLAIARAAVADPPVLILDEATSSIDTRTENIVQRGMDQLMEGRTVFVIAHRLSTVKNSKAIMVLEKGRIIERGDHDELIEQKGQYYQLYTGAFELS